MHNILTTKEICEAIEKITDYDQLRDIELAVLFAKLDIVYSKQKIL